MKKKLLSFITAGLMLGGVSQTKAMDQATQEEMLSAFINTQSNEFIMQQALSGHRVIMFADRDGFAMQPMIKDGVPGIQIFHAIGAKHNVPDNRLGADYRITDHYILVTERFNPLVKRKSSESNVQYLARIQNQKDLLYRKYMNVDWSAKMIQNADESAHV